MHGGQSVDHTFTLSADSCVSCHTEGTDLASLHSEATTTTPQGTFSSCRVCHTSNTQLPVSADCAACHPDRVAYHGYDAIKHESGETCIDACHDSELGPEHSARGLACSACHQSTDQRVRDAIANNQTGCWSCHDFSDHPYTPATHSSDATTTVLSGVSPSITCSACHAPDLRDEHDRPTASSAPSACADCHPSPRSSFADWAKGCVQGGCHAAGGTAEMHGGEAADHLAGAEADACRVCHSGTDLESLHSNATTTVAGDVRTSCRICHTSNTSLPISGGCSSCHDLANPHGDVSSKHATNVTYGYVDMFSDHDGMGGVSMYVSCSMCHPVSNLLPIHDNDCALCHPSPRNSFTNWGKTCQQGNCHPWIHENADGGHESEYNDGCYCHDVGESNCGACHVTGDSTAPMSSSDAVASYSGAAIIHLSAVDNAGGSGVAHTYYKLDGGPRQDGSVVSVYSGGSHTLEFWAADKAMNHEQPHHTVTFTITPDTIAPSTTSNAQATYSTLATINLTAFDTGGSGVAHTYYRLDGGPQTEGTVINVYSGPSHEIEFWSVDNAGNVESPRKTASFTITNLDTVSPTTTSNIGAYVRYSSFSPVFTATDPSPATGVASVRTSSPNITYVGPASKRVDGTWSCYVYSNAQGPRTLYYSAVDNAGNVESTKTANFTFDWTAPVTTSNALSSYSGTAEIDLTATDAYSAVATTRYRIDSGSWQTGTHITVPAPSSGQVTHYIYFYSTDVAGNTESTKWKSFVQSPPPGTTYTLTYTAGPGGTISGTSPQTVPHGGSGTPVTAVPNTGYRFTGWSDGVISATRTDTNVMANKSVVASFAAESSGAVTLELNDTTWYDAYLGSTGGWGTFSIYADGVLIGTKPADGTTTWNCPQTTVSSGARIDIVADCGFTNLTGTWDTHTPLTFTTYLPAGSTRLEAATWLGFPALQVGEAWYDDYYSDYMYAVIPPGTISNIAYGSATSYTLTYTAGPNGTISGTSPQTVPSGGSGTAVTAVPNTGYHFVNWSDGSTANPRTDTNVTANKSVTANFAINTYTLTYTAGANGTISGTSPQTVSHGGSGTAVTAVPNSGYNFVNWSDGSTANPRTDTNVTSNKSVTANFEAGGGSASTSLSLNDYAWLDANYGASGAWGTFSIYANGVLIGTKAANATSTWSCPQTTVPSGARIDVVVDMGFLDYSWIFDDNVPKTFTTYLPAGSTRLEAATWTGFPNITVVSDWWDDYDDDYTGVYTPPATIGNIMYSGTSGGDTTAPTGSIAINGGASYTNTTASTLTLSASDTGGSGLSQMRFSNDNVTWSSWEAYATTKSWTLASGSGTKTVYVQYRDGAGNVSSTYSDTIVLDTAGPTGSITINGGAAETNSTTVTLTLSASDTGGSGLSQMRFSNDNVTWSSWEAYASTKSWTLSSGDGAKTVYVQYRDGAGNVSSTYSDGITLTTGSTATLAFVWHPEDWAEAHLRVKDSSGNTIKDQWVSGYGADLDLYVTVPSGQLYYMECVYYYDEWWGDEGGPYGKWTNDTSINPDGILSPGEVVTWYY